MTSSAPTAHWTRSTVAQHAEAPGGATHSRPLAGLGPAVRLIIRRDRLRTTLWSVGVIGMVAASASSIIALYDTQAELDQYAQLMNDNTALIVQAGPGYGLDAPTTGSVLMNELGIWTIVAISLMNIFIVVRHTRTEEEAERAELMRAAPVGRYTAIVAAMIGAMAINLIVVGGVVAALVLFGLPTVGSIAFGATMLGAGSTFAAVGAVAAQVAANSRSALAIGGITLAASFVIRAIGDVGSGHLSWLSPIGSAQAIRAFAVERWWVLIISIASALALLVLAVGLQAHRDYGAGVIAPRVGRAEASPSLRTPLALTFRLQRATIIAWSIGLGLMGLFYGVVADQAETILEDNPEMEEFFAHLGNASITDAYLATSVLMLALIASGFTISSVLRLRSEEVATRTDSVLATHISRQTWAASHLVVSAVGSAVVLGVAGAATGVGFAAMTGDIGHVTTLLGAALAMVPALWVMGGVTMLLYGARPMWSLAAWLTLVGVLVVGILGNVLGLPSWSQNLSPFQHVPAIPAVSFTLVPIVLLVAVAATAAAAGVAAFRRRDIS